ncbi:MAG: glycine dehydrogenase, partial [Candidatus Omnitrophica bacterium]|nr:glycine dehydrogenase [Candidatus Omnitrophota bacterium]
MHYHPLTEEDRKAMLKEIGVSSVEDLMRGIPASIRNPKIRLSEGQSEFEIQKLFRDLSFRNRTVHDCLSFLGAGSYDHFIPAAVFDIIGRHEFYTA